MSGLRAHEVPLSSNQNTVASSRERVTGDSRSWGGALKHILGERAAPALGALARADALLVFDFDGTLAPILGNPRRARMRAPTRRLLSNVARAFPIAILSGRSRADLVARLAGVCTRRLVGNHGCEPGGCGQHQRRRRSGVARWREFLVPKLAGLEGVLLEDKGLSLSVHYRAAPHPPRARTQIRRALEHLRGARIVEGKCVLNVLPASAPHKGAALRRLLRAEEPAAALFVGDDVTDEDVFRMRLPQVVGVRVGRSRKSAARYYLSSQSEISCSGGCSS